jgi:methyltransferase
LTLLGKRICVALPDTLLEERDSQRDKTAKLGLVARACAIYGVDLVEVFGDEGGRGEAALIMKVLEYLETPQYLRRRLYPLDEALKYAGVLPPLRIPSHKPRVSVESLSVGDVREGVANSDGTVDVGLDKSPKLEGRVQANRRVTVRITVKAPLMAVAMPRGQAPEYWGYAVGSSSREEVFADGRFDLKVATSKLGGELKGQMPWMRDRMKGAEGIKLVFGSPSRGLFEIFGAQLAREADFVVNLFPEQHVETVRTEEAIFAGLNLATMLAL